MSKYRAKAGGARVRTEPKITNNNNIGGVVNAGETFNANVVPNVPFVKVELKITSASVGGITLVPSAANDNTVDGYISTEVCELVTVTPPPVVQPPPIGENTAIGRHPALPALPMHLRLGVHNLQRIEEARECLALGCRSFTSLDNISGAREMRNGGAAVIVRRFMHHGSVPDPIQFARAYGIQADDTLICMGTNEADNLSTSDLPTRFAWDRPWALEMHRLYPNCFIVIGSFSMGTPQIENPEVARVFRELYGAFLNENADWCGLNYHSYHRRHSSDLPPPSEAVQDGAWWPKRFIQWGYDAGYGGMSKRVVMVSDEAFVDIGGIGGAPACGYNDQSFLRWWSLQRSWFEPHPQIYVQNVFQYSNSESWAGYNARCILGGMTLVWQNRVPRDVAAYEMSTASEADYTDSPVTEPEPKDLSNEFSRESWDE